jgi:hypothetical protein
MGHIAISSLVHFFLRRFFSSIDKFYTDSFFLPSTRLQGKFYISCCYHKCCDDYNRKNHPNDDTFSPCISDVLPVVDAVEIPSAASSINGA